MKMCWWACSHTLRDHVRNDNIRESISERGRKARLRWFAHVEARPIIRRKKDSGDGTTWEKKARKTEAETVSTETWEISGQEKMTSMTELAGGELCLPQRPHNQVGAARRRRFVWELTNLDPPRCRLPERRRVHLLRSMCSRVILQLRSAAIRLVLEVSSSLSHVWQHIASQLGQATFHVTLINCIFAAKYNS